MPMPMRSPMIGGSPCRTSSLSCSTNSWLAIVDLRRCVHLVRGVKSNMPDNWDQPERFLKLPEVCRRVGLGKTMIYALIQQGRFPKPYKPSPSAPRWSERELVAWIADVKDGFEGKRRVRSSKNNGGNL